MSDAMRIFKEQVALALKNKIFHQMPPDKVEEIANLITQALETGKYAELTKGAATTELTAQLREPLRLTKAMLDQQNITDIGETSRYGDKLSRFIGFAFMIHISISAMQDKSPPAAASMASNFADMNFDSLPQNFVASELTGDTRGLGSGPGGTLTRGELIGVELQKAVEELTTNQLIEKVAELYPELGVEAQADVVQQFIAAFREENDYDESFDILDEHLSEVVTLTSGQLCLRYAQMYECIHGILKATNVLVTKANDSVYALYESSIADDDEASQDLLKAIRILSKIRLDGDAYTAHGIDIMISGLMMELDPHRSTHLENESPSLH